MTRPFAILCSAQQPDLHVSSNYEVASFCYSGWSQGHLAWCWVPEGCRVHGTAGQGWEHQARSHQHRGPAPGPTPAPGHQGLLCPFSVETKVLTLPPRPCGLFLSALQSRSVSAVATLAFLCLDLLLDSWARLPSPHLPIFQGSVVPRISCPSTMPVASH